MESLTLAPERFLGHSHDITFGLLRGAVGESALMTRAIMSIQQSVEIPSVLTYYKGSIIDRS